MITLSPLKADCLIFDIDGVLIDTAESFPSVIREAIPWAWKNILNRDAGESPFSMDHYRVTKQHPAFNDDYDIAWAMLVAAAHKGEASLNASFPTVDEWADLLQNFNTTDMKNWIKDRFGEDVADYEMIRQICKEFYFGEEEIRRFTSEDPQFINCSGLWKNEKPMIGISWRESPLPIGIYTGRNRNELDLALRTLGWEDFPAEHAVTYDDDVHKPSPGGLEILCSRLECHWPLYFGDAASDRQTLINLGYGDFIAIGKTLKNADFRFITLADALRALLGI